MTQRSFAVCALGSRRFLLELAWLFFSETLSWATCTSETMRSVLILMAVGVDVCFLSLGSGSGRSGCASLRPRLTVSQKVVGRGSLGVTFADAFVTFLFFGDFCWYHFLSSSLLCQTPCALTVLKQKWKVLAHPLFIYNISAVSAWGGSKVYVMSCIHKLSRSKLSMAACGHAEHTLILCHQCESDASVLIDQHLLVEQVVRPHAVGNRDITYSGHWHDYHVSPQI